jgi:hypothetical protein
MSLIDSKPIREFEYNFASFLLNFSVYYQKLEEITLIPSSRILILFKKNEKND